MYLITDGKAQTILCRNLGICLLYLLAAREHDQPQITKEVKLKICIPIRSWKLKRIEAEAETEAGRGRN